MSHSPKCPSCGKKISTKRLPEWARDQDAVIASLAKMAKMMRKPHPLAGLPSIVVGTLGETCHTADDVAWAVAESAISIDTPGVGVITLHAIDRWLLRKNISRVSVGQPYFNILTRKMLTKKGIV